LVGVILAVRCFGGVFAAFFMKRSKRSQASGSNSTSLASFFGGFAMTNPSSASPVTPDHALWFGHIINIFAQLELLMMVCAAGILEQNLGTAYILMGDTNYRQKQQTLRHLNSTIGVNGGTDGELRAILKEIHTYAGLRNAIAHSLWVTGNRPNSIKPMQVLLRSETLKAIGHWHNEQSYTVDDLRDAAIKLDSIAVRFNRFLDAAGLHEKVAAKIEETKPSISSSSGSPSSK
jgi:hypothetical protein